MALIELVFGTGDALSAGNMAARAAVIFVVALVLVRVAGRRSFGQHSAFDIATTVLPGAVLSRAVVGASPFGATVAAGAALALMHRLLGYLSVRSEAFERLISGTERVLLRDGERDARQLRKALITEADLRESLRKSGLRDAGGASLIVLERNGDLTVERRVDEAAGP